MELVQHKGAYLVAVQGNEARRYRNEIRQLGGVQLAFPMGLRLNVWLDDSYALEDFRQALQQISSSLTAEPLKPSLHDATLHDMVLAEEPQQHARAG